MNKNKILTRAGKFDTTIQEMRLSFHTSLKANASRLATISIRLQLGAKAKRLFKVVIVPTVALITFGFLLAMGGGFGGLFTLYPVETMIVIVASIVLSGAGCYIWYGDDGSEKAFAHWVGVPIIFILSWVLLFAMWAGSIFVFEVAMPFAFPPDPASLTKQEACNMLNKSNPLHGQSFSYDGSTCWWNDGGELTNVDNTKGFDLYYWEMNKVIKESQ